MVVPYPFSLCRAPTGSQIPAVGTSAGDRLIFAGRDTVDNVSETNMLGDYLRSRRGSVQPDDAGLVASGARRVPGLRREEVAMLAGISSNYYLRLEQGHDRHPSVQVLEALARVLRLDDEAAEYLLSLAAPRPSRRRRRARRAAVPASIGQLLEVETLPALVLDRYYDVLAANSLAQALSPTVRPGLNRLSAVFLDPAERALYPDWDSVTAHLTANFRGSVGSCIDDPRFIELVGELSLSSERFRRLWASQEVRTLDGEPMHFLHPLVGDLVLNRNKFDINGVKGQTLVLFHPEPGSDSAEKLALLASLTASA
jgi:transcriptional regulator with XRE-family HTH domain